MSPFLEFEDKTVEKAVNKASEALNIPKEKLKHEVISHGATGIFGLIGTKKARIRVTIPDQEKKPESIAESETIKIKAPSTSLVTETIEEEDSHKKADREAQKDKIFPDDPMELAQTVLQRIVDFITTDATIKVRNGSKNVLFEVEGGNPAVLIGKHGQTLEAIQYLVVLLHG